MRMGDVSAKLDKALEELDALWAALEECPGGRIGWLLDNAYPHEYKNMAKAQQLRAARLRPQPGERVTVDGVMDENGHVRIWVQDWCVTPSVHTSMREVSIAPAAERIHAREAR